MRLSFSTLVLKMQRVRLLGRTVNICLLGEKAFLRRKVFTMEGPGKGNGVPCITVGDREQEEKVLQPFTYIQQAPGKQFRPKLFHAFNYWLKVPADKFNLVSDVVEMLNTSTILIDDVQDNSILRRGIPAAHTIYGVASTINAATYVFFIGLNRVQCLNHPKAIALSTEHLLELYQGQGMEIYWRDKHTCPSVKEYKEMAKRKTGALFSLGIQLLQLFSENTADFTKLTGILGVYYQICNDYRSLCRQEYSQDKDCYEDLTEGKFSFPIIHAITSHPDDSQIICILRQRTRDEELKKYCVTLLEKFGSLSYTRRTLEELDAEARTEVAKLGGNPVLEDVLDKLIEWKKWNDMNKAIQ